MFNKKYNYLILFTLLFTGLIVSGCSKWSSGTTTVEFVIINPANGEPFPNVNVKIVEETSTNKGGGVICEGKTDASGRITFEFTGKRTSKYWYTPVIDTDYFGPYENWEYLIRPKVSSYAIIKNVYNEMRYEITFYAYLRDEIKNINCEGIGDTLFFHRKYLELNKGTKVYDNRTVHAGCYEYETVSIDGNPVGHRKVFMGTHIYNYEVHRLSGVTFGSDTIYLNKGELGTLQAFY